MKAEKMCTSYLIAVVSRIATRGPESTRPESSTNRRLQLEVIERKDW